MGQWDDLFEWEAVGDAAMDVPSTLVDYGGDAVLNVDDFLPAPFEFDALPADTPEIIENPVGSVFENEEEFQVTREDGGPLQSGPGQSSIQTGLPSRVPLSTGGPAGLLSTAIGAGITAATRRIAAGSQQPGMIYLPGARPGSMNVPGNPAATQYRAPVGTPIAAKVSDFVKKNAVPLALGGLALLFLVNSRKGKRA